MPSSSSTSPARKLRLSSTTHGLLIQPLNSRGQVENNKSVRIEWGTRRIVPFTSHKPRRTGTSKARGNAAGAAQTRGAAESSDSDDDDDAEGESTQLEVYGIVGMLDLVKSGYLVVITEREQVAQIRGRAVFAVRDVLVVPLGGREEARKVLVQGGVRKANGKGGKGAGEEEETEAETDVSDAESVATDIPADGGEEGTGGDARKTEREEEVGALEAPKAGSPLQKSTTFVKNVVQDRGNYGRFASKWFSKGGWTASGRRSQGMTSEEQLIAEQNKQGDAPVMGEKIEEGQKKEERENGDETVTADDSEKKEEAPTGKSKSVIESLTPRIVRSARIYFASSGFYFSYDHDLSGTVMSREPPASSLPLWKRFEELVFWNRHLVTPFVEAGQDSLILPLMQGFVGQRAFSIKRTEGTEQDVVGEAAQHPAEVIAAQTDATPAPAPKKPVEEGGKPQEEFLLTLISRRSVKRAGLRYLRRGVDDDGNVANSVETEQILSSQSWDSTKKTFSLIQIRGSIPLFFSQSPYSFKPMPQLFGSEGTNQTAFRKHFDWVTKRYGDVQVASLVDKHGTEVGIGESYEHHSKLLNEHGGPNGKNISFEWFDFHSACKGMNFQNVSILLETLQSPLNNFGWVVKQNDRNIRTQSGVLRTNCMDCLDRSNVVQSAVGGWAVQQQLQELGLVINLQTDPKTQWFNTLWADNGDAISRQYAGTSALKGDFTRTRKRNWTGALFDFSLTLNRYFNNIFSDYFLQTLIDYFLGNAGPSTFDDFEADMMSQDRAIDMRRIRQNAIDTCVKIVLADPQEDLLGGWTLGCPSAANTLRTPKFEECVLLLTDAAMYFCRFDWSTEKVSQYERVDLLDIKEMWRGVYITSTLGPTHMDEKTNVGFAMRYSTKGGRAMVRTNTRSLDNEKAASAENEGKSELEKQQTPEKDEVRLLAFKALPPRSAASSEENAGDVGEGEQVRVVCEEVQRAVAKAVARDGGGSDVLETKEKDVISLAKAKKATGYIESLGYGLKRMIWS